MRWILEGNLCNLLLIENEFLKQMERIKCSVLVIKSLNLKLQA